MAVNPQTERFFDARQRIAKVIAERYGLKIDDANRLIASKALPMQMYVGDAVTPTDSIESFVPDPHSEFTPEQMAILEVWMTQEIEEHNAKEASQ